MYTLNKEHVRVFGCSLLHILLCLLVLALLLGQIILPMPSYYIKHQDNTRTDASSMNAKFSLNKILEEEAEKSGIEFDKGSFKVIDSYDMNFNKLFLYSYQIEGKEQARIFQFEKNIFGNMRPKYSFKDAYITPEDGKNDSPYHVFVKDGIFGEYIIIAGYATEMTALENYELSDFIVDALHPSNYFMVVELIRQPWKSQLVEIILLTILGSIIGMFRKKARRPIKFYCKWQKGDKIIQYIKEKVNSN